MNLKEKTFSKASLPACKDDTCPQIAISILEAEGNSSIAKNFNKAIDEKIAAILIITPDDETRIKTIDQGISNFIETYRSANADFPEESSNEGYEFTSMSSIGFENDYLLSVKIETYSYWGGAHGYSSISYLNFDKKSGLELENDKLIKDSSKFKELAEQAFRKEKNIAPDANINENGYFFEDDTFSLPANIGFEGDDLILIYNPYEIAAYAEGQIKITIPKAEAAPFLSVRL
ncbi:MAG: DUF3298 domain-containing protein [Leeuwenhoekiella sp.]